MPYVDGFVVPVPRRHVQEYRRIARKAGKLWMKHGALEYKECLGDDLYPKWAYPFPRMAKLKRGETVLFSWIKYQSRRHRDRVNAKVMADPAMVRMMEESRSAPFDLARMAYGGFKIVVDL